MGKRPPSKGWNECGFYIERTPDFSSNWGVGGNSDILLQGVPNEGPWPPPPCVKRAGRRLAKAAAVKQYAGVGAGKIAVISALSPQRGFSLILRRAAIGRQIQEFNVSLAFTIMSDRYANSAQVLRHSYLFGSSMLLIATHYTSSSALS